MRFEILFHMPDESRVRIRCNSWEQVNLKCSYFDVKNMIHIIEYES